MDHKSAALQHQLLLFQLTIVKIGDQFDLEKRHNIQREYYLLRLLYLQIKLEISHYHLYKALRCFRELKEIRQLILSNVLITLVQFPLLLRHNVYYFFVSKR